jgi:hypothetical protein
MRGLLAGRARQGAGAKVRALAGNAGGGGGGGTSRGTGQAGLLASRQSQVGGEQKGAHGQAGGAAVCSHLVCRLLRTPQLCHHMVRN